MNSNREEEIRGIRELSENIEISPSADQYYLRGNIYFNRGDYDEAIEDFSKAIMYFQHEGEEHKVQRSLVLFGRGESLFGLKKFNEAIEDFTNIIKDSCEDFDQIERVFNSRGLCYQQIRIGDQKSAFTNAIECSVASEQGSSEINRATYYYNRSQSLKSSANLIVGYISDLRNASELYLEISEKRECYHQILEKLYDLEDDENRLRVGYEALDFLIEHSSGYNEIDYLFKRLDLSRYHNELEIEETVNDINGLMMLEKREILRKYLKKNSKKCEYTERKLYLLRAELYLRMNEKEKCLSDLESVRTFESKDYKSYKKMCEIYLSLNNKKRALECINKAIELTKNRRRSQHEVRVIRGDIYLSQREYRKGIDDYLHSLTNPSKGKKKLYVIGDLKKIVYLFFRHDRIVDDTLKNSLRNLLATNILDRIISNVVKKNVPIWFSLRGRIHLRRRKYASAERDFTTEKELLEKLILEGSHHVRHVNLDEYIKMCLFRRSEARFELKKYQECVSDGIRFLKMERGEYDVVNKREKRMYFRLIYSYRNLEDHTRTFFFERILNISKRGLCSIPREFKKKVLEGGYYLDYKKYIAASEEELEIDMEDYTAAYIAGYEMIDRDMLLKFLTMKFLNGVGHRFSREFDEMLRKEFGPQRYSEEEVDERLTFIIDSGLLNSDERSVKIKWEDDEKLINIPLYFTPNIISSSMNEVFVIDSKIPKIKEKMLLKCLYLGFHISLKKNPEIRSSHFTRFS